MVRGGPGRTKYDGAASADVAPMVSPLVAVIVSSISTGLFATFLMALAVATGSWQSISWDGEQLYSVYDGNSSGEQYRVRPASCQHCYMLEVRANPDADDNETWVYERHLFNSYSSIWYQCAEMTDKLREIVYGEMARCYVFVIEYKEETSLFTKNGKWVARMHNSAASCFIVSLIDMVAAFVVGTIGLAQRQVSMSMITGVLYVLAALFGMFGIIIFLTKYHHEMYRCYSIYGTIPPELCPARTVSLLWSHYVAWVAVIFSVFASILWLFLSRVLRVIKSKTML